MTRPNPKQALLRLRGLLDRMDLSPAEIRRVLDLADDYANEQADWALLTEHLPRCAHGTALYVSLRNCWECVEAQSVPHLPEMVQPPATRRVARPQPRCRLCGRGEKWKNVHLPVGSPPVSPQAEGL